MKPLVRWGLSIAIGLALLVMVYLISRAVASAQTPVPESTAIADVPPQVRITTAGTPIPVLA